MAEAAANVVLSARILPETQMKLREISKGTYRGIGDTLDWLVDEAYKRYRQEAAGSDAAAVQAAK